MSSLSLVKTALGMVVVLLILTIVSVAQAPVPEPVTDQETELGQAVYKQLQDKGEIIKSSPLYDTLKPIADAITREAQPHYPHPTLVQQSSTKTHSIGR